MNYSLRYSIDCVAFGRTATFFLRQQGYCRSFRYFCSLTGSLFIPQTCQLEIFVPLSKLFLRFAIVFKVFGSALLLTTCSCHVSGEFSLTSLRFRERQAICVVSFFSVIDLAQLVRRLFCREIRRFSTTGRFLSVSDYNGTPARIRKLNTVGKFKESNMRHVDVGSQMFLGSPCVQESQILSVIFLLYLHGRYGSCTAFLFLLIYKFSDKRKSRRSVNRIPKCCERHSLNNKIKTTDSV